MSSVSRKVAVNDVMLHCDITGTGSHSVLLLPGALGVYLSAFHCTQYADCTVSQLFYFTLK